MSHIIQIDYALEISKGNLEGVSHVNKFGRNTDIDTTQEDIWDGGGDYTFSTSADITDIVSSNAGDTMSIEVQGLDSGWNLVVQNVTLTGTTSATLGTALIRVFRARNLTSTAALGDIQIGVGSTTSSFSAANLRAQISLGYEQTRMAIYTIPNGKTGYMTSHWGNINKSNTSGALDCTMWERSFGGVFRAQTPNGLIAAGSSHYQHKLDPYQKFSAKTDIKMTGIGSTNNFDVSAGFDLVLVDD